MPNVLEYACLSQDVYIDHKDGIFKNGYYSPKSNFISSNWVGLPNIYDDIKPFSWLPDGFFARVYANIFTQETVIAYRGTNFSESGDREADVELTLKKWSGQDTDALNFYDWVISLLNNQTTTNFSRFPKLTGHSLGGYLAQIVAAKYSGVKAVVFNAPKIGFLSNPAIGNIDPHNPSYTKTIYNYDLDTDFIHHVGGMVGNQQVLPGDTVCKVIEMPGRAIFNPAALMFAPNRVMAGVMGYCGAYKEHSIDTVVDIIHQHNDIAIQTIN